MTLRRIVVADPARVNRAVLAPATRKDSYKIDDAWRGVGDYDTWIYGQPVEGVRQFPKGGYEVGDTVEMYDLADRLGATMKIEAIRMIVCDFIADGDLELLGYRDRDEWLDQAKEGLAQRKAWLLIGSVVHQAATGPGIATGVIAERNVETGEVKKTVVDLRDQGSRVQ